MPEEVRSQQPSDLTLEVEAALGSLDEALAEASRSVAVVRSKVAQFSALANVVRELETAMARARQNLAGPPGPTPLRPVPPPDEQYAPQPAAPGYEAPQQAYAAQPQAYASQPQAYTVEPQAPAHEAPGQEPQPYVYEPPPAPQAPQQFEAPAQEISWQPPTEAPAGEPAPAVSEFDRPVPHCLRLGVSSKTGSLDLKAVDGSVNENPSVVDVALLDYDGRHATLKLWISGTADPYSVRDSLTASLRRRLGDEQDAEVRIDFEGSAA